MNKHYIVFMIICLLLTPVYALDEENNGEILFQRYCGRCHGDSDRRSGALVFHSKKTIMSRYKHRSRQFLNVLNNIDKYSISNIMIKAIHKIEDKRVLILIVNHLSDPPLPLPGDKKKKNVLIKEL